jgi:hypothetical protein
VVRPKRQINGSKEELGLAKCGYPFPGWKFNIYIFIIYKVNRKIKLDFLFFSRSFLRMSISMARTLRKW